MTVVSIILVVGAFSTLRSIRTSDVATPTETNAEDTLTQANLAPKPAIQPPPPEETIPLSPPRVSIIGGRCLPSSTSGTTADGSVAYCERLQGSDAYMWSLYPGDITLPDSAATNDQGEQVDPAVAVCMDQTGRTAEDCVIYLEQPSNPGDGPQ